MKYILIIMAVLAFINGVFNALGATTVFQQIVGGISFVIAAILFSSSGIIEAINRLEKKMGPSDTNKSENKKISGNFLPGVTLPEK